MRAGPAETIFHNGVLLTGRGRPAGARELPKGAWLQGRGYNEARFPDGRPPTRADLDAVIADRPVVSAVWNGLS